MRCLKGTSPESKSKMCEELHSVEGSIQREKHARALHGGCVSNLDRVKVQRAFQSRVPTVAYPIS